MSKLQNRGLVGTFGLPTPSGALGPGDGRRITVRRTTDGTANEQVTVGTAGFANAVRLPGIDFFSIGAVDFGVTAGGLITYFGPSGRQTLVHLACSLSPASTTVTNAALLLKHNAARIVESAQYNTSQNTWADQVSTFWQLSLNTGDTIEANVARFAPAPSGDIVTALPLIVVT